MPALTTIFAIAIGAAAVGSGVWFLREDRSARGGTIPSLGLGDAFACDEEWATDREALAGGEAGCDAAGRRTQQTMSLTHRGSGF